MYTLNFTLKQHTPIIHFQHEQEGATLRATEVKPKLDRFIIENVFHNSFEECKIFLVGFNTQKPNELKEKFEKGFRALNYRLSINISNSYFELFQLGYPERRKNDDGRPGFKCIWGIQFPNYFGNMKTAGEIKDPKYFTYCSNQFDNSISSMFVELIQIIKVNLAQFFFLKNFGTRQDKGFGSFTITKIRLGDKSENITQLFPAPFFDVDIKVTEYSKLIYFPEDKLKFKQTFLNDLKVVLSSKGYQGNQIAWLHKHHNLFNYIELLYKSLRSGINVPRQFYFKSLMFQYAKQLKPSQQWDKRTLREHFYIGNNNYENLKHDRPDDGTLKYTPLGTHEKDIFLFRDLLGLSTIQEWKFYNDTITKEGTRKENGETLVQRFKSPITFKPVLLTNEGPHRVYILTQPIPNDYIGQDFAISNGRKSKTLKIPQFDIDDYLKSCFTKFVIDNTKSDPPEVQFNQYVNGSKSDEARILKNIYIQLNRYNW